MIQCLTHLQRDRVSTTPLNLHREEVSIFEGLVNIAAVVVVHHSHLEAAVDEDRGHTLLGEVGIAIEDLGVSCSLGCN